MHTSTNDFAKYVWNFGRDHNIFRISGTSTIQNIAQLNYDHQNHHDGIKCNENDTVQVKLYKNITRSKSISRDIEVKKDGNYIKC